MEKENERRILTTVTTLLGLTLFAMSANVLAATARLMGEEFGQSEAVFVKWTMPVQFTGFVALCFLGGLASDRFGKRITMLLTCVTMALGSIIWIIAPNLSVLYVGALVVGMAGGVIETVGSAGLTDLHPTRSKLFMNLSQIFYCLGAISVGALVGILIAQGVPWRVFYMALVIISVLLAVAYSFARFPKKKSEMRNADGPSSLKLILQLLPDVWLPSLAVFMYVYGETALYAFGPNYMKQLGASEQVSTMSIAVFWTAVVIGRMACSLLPQKQTYEYVIGGLFLVSCLAACCQILATGWMSAMVLIALNGLACSGTWPLMVSMVATRNFEYSGTASGIAIGVGALGCIMSPLTLGNVFDQGHTDSAFLLLGTSFFLGFVCIAGTFVQYRRKMAGK